MNRFFFFSIILHLAFIVTIAISSRGSFKPLPKFEIYKVSLAPMPQPRIMTAPIPEKGEGKEETKPMKPEKKEEKALPLMEKSREKIAPKKGETEIKPPAKTKGGGTSQGLPDITPQIYTGSGRGFNYSYYLNILLSKVGQNWQNPFKDSDVVLKSIVYFEIDKNGNIYNIRLEEDSGNDLYNETTIRAVASTKKLPPLPEEFSTDFLKVHLEFLTAQ